MMKTRFNALVDLAITLGCIGLAFAAVAPAHAQTRVTGGEFRRNTVVDESLLRQGRMELALTLAAMYASNTVSGTVESSTQKNTYINPALLVGYMLTDAFELRLSIGVQYLGSSISDGEFSQQTLSAVSSLQLLYQRDFVNGLRYPLNRKPVSQSHLRQRRWARAAVAWAHDAAERPAPPPWGDSLRHALRQRDGGG